MALFAYFVDAIVFIIDKYLIASRITDPYVYAFGGAILSAGAIVLIPFGVSMPSLFYLATALISGGAFFIAIVFIYKAVKISDVSVVSTNVGAISAIFTYIFSFLILKDTLSNIHFFAFLLLVAGIFFIGRIEKSILKYSIISGLFLGLSFVLMKWDFNHSGFINGIFWTRVGFVLAGLLSLLDKTIRNNVSASLRSTSKSSKLIFIFNKVLAGIGFVMIYYAIRLGNVSLVNALLGFQFVFVFLLAVIIKGKLSEVGENLQRPVLINKILGIVFVFVGFLTLIFR